MVIRSDELIEDVEIEKKYLNELNLTQQNCLRLLIAKEFIPEKVETGLRWLLSDRVWRSMG